MHGMFGSRPTFLAFPLSVLTLVLAPSLASASSHSEHPVKARRTARALDSRPCSKPPIEIVAGSESATFPLERCDGEPIPASLDKLSILARPAGTAKPKEPLAGAPHGAQVAPGIRRLDVRLAQRLEIVADHFRKEGEPLRIVLAAPKSPTAGSYHASGRAIDFRIEGVDNDAVAAFCKTVQDTGCGFYPNEGFVHMDVRDAGAGHVAWIDISKAGEAPKYVSAWPLPSGTRKSETVTAESPKAETARAEAQPASAPKGADDFKSEPPPAADRDDDSKLPPLPAAAAVVPMADAPSAPAASEPAPAKKHHRRHKKSRNSHMI
jgi:Bacterial protein of unknown function (DUF882)